MPKPDDGLQKHTLNLFAGDYDRLRDLHPELKPAEIIRALIRRHIADVVKAVPTPETLN